MAVMVDAGAVTAEARVATTALRAYAARHERVREVWLTELLSGGVAGDVKGVKAIAAADLRIAEIVLPEESACDSVSPAVRMLAARGWEVSVLVPTTRLGEAHAALRSTPCRLQPWWLEDGEVSFGGYETP